MSAPNDFVCGTRRVVTKDSPHGVTYRVVCATCGAGGTVSHPTSENAQRACVRDSNQPCYKCGAS